MSTEIDRLMNNLRIRVPGATDAALKLELFNVIDEFCSDTNVWKEVIEVPITAGVKGYILTPTGISEIVRFMGLVNASGISITATMPVPGELLLRTTPSSATSAEATVSLTITDPVTRDEYPVLPDWIWARYSLEFQNGVMGKMFSQIAKPYSNERMAIYHMRKFEGAVSRARVEARHDFTYAAQRWMFPQAFAVRRK